MSATYEAWLPLLRAAMLAVLLGLAAWFYWGAGSARSLAKLRESFATRNQARISPELVPEFDARMATRSRRMAVAMAVVAPAMALAPIHREVSNNYVSLVILASFFVALTVIQFIEFATPFGVASAVRTAHLRAVCVDDLVSPGRRRVGRLVSGFLLFLLGLLVFARTRGWWDGSSLGWWGLTGSVALVIALSIGFAYAARRIAALPQPAGDEASLYLQDALRSEALSELYRRCTMFALLLGWAVFGGLSVQDRIQPGWWVVLTLVPLFGGLLLVMADAALLGIQLTSANPWFRRRLWPQLAPGEVLEPQQPEQDVAS